MSFYKCHCSLCCETVDLSLRQDWRDRLQNISHVCSYAVTLTSLVLKTHSETPTAISPDAIIILLVLLLLSASANTMYVYLLFRYIYHLNNNR